MPRALRFQYVGAVYHLMARGDGGKVIFADDEDRKVFLFRLAKVCGSHGWRVHAWVLMNNHFHLLVETPEANLVTGMKQLLGTFSQGWNRRRMRRGHVFQGRYKSIPVNAIESDPYYYEKEAPCRNSKIPRRSGSRAPHGGCAHRPWNARRPQESRKPAEGTAGKSSYCGPVEGTNDGWKPLDCATVGDGASWIREPSGSKLQQ